MNGLERGRGGNGALCKTTLGRSADRVELLEP